MKELFTFTVSELGSLSGEPLPESGLELTRAATLRNAHPSSIIFATALSTERLQLLTRAHDCLLLLPTAEADSLPATIRSANVIAWVANPRLSYARIMNVVAANLVRPGRLECRGGAWISTDADIADDVLIEPGAFIDHSVSICSGTRISTGAIIRAYSHIGPDSVVRDGAAVGVFGFAYERDERGVPVPIPHFGGVHTGRGADIGSFSTICAGTIDPTLLGDNVKVDSLVHIAHNCEIGDNTLVIACAEVSGSVRIGCNCWIGPNASVIEGHSIGDGSVIGLGAAVLKDVDPLTTVAGNPALSTRLVSRRNRALSALVEAYYADRQPE